MRKHWRPEKNRDALHTRARMIHAIRDFLINREYLEVETPSLIPSPIPEPHIDAVSCGDLYLHTSPELCMKRLLAAGYHKIFQICKCFRSGERGSFHLPEFTMLEWYCEGMDYHLLMEECEDLIISVSHTLGHGDIIHYRGKTLSLIRPWEILSVRDAFSRYAPLPMDEALKEGLFDELMVCHIEPHLGSGQPTFLFDYPVTEATLAKEKAEEPDIAERFELYMGGVEIANACSELTDIREHHRRIEKVQHYRHSMNKRIYQVSEHVLRDIFDMPDAAGIALGVDRLAMIFTNASAIDNVVAFIPECN